MMEYITFVGGVLAGLGIALLFFKPAWKKQGRIELLNSFRKNEIKLKKKTKTIRFEDMTDEEYADYADSLANNAQ